MERKHIEKYLIRIGYNDSLEPSLNTLMHLQKAHLMHVPFENLDIHFGNRIILEVPKLYAKIVDRHRGGFCYELNGLFFALLQALGFEGKMISARVRTDKGGFSREFDHMALIVVAEGVEYLVDVGFGRFVFGPLKLELGLVQEDRGGEFKIEKHDEQYWRVSKKQEESWIPEYIFTLIPRALSDYNDMCHYHQTSPESHFTKKAVCSLPTEKGRITVAEDKVIIKKKEDTEEVKIEDRTQFLAHLWEYFQIKIQQ